MKRFVCIHGHFYQPPRENPWLEHVELQESAYPYHDWNERITAECYAPNTASRILDPERRIVDIVNNYSRISFNFGPTLLSWLEANRPEVYEAIVEADRRSRDLFNGHGSAIAQPYNHMIMPLANERDKRTQVIWGIRDFEHRFGRKPEGMWLPETAVDLESLDIMAEQGITFTILAPHQAKRVRKLEDKKWIDVGDSRVDPKQPYICQLPSGRTITIFFYDGPISRDVAFGNVLTSGEALASRLLDAFTGGKDQPQLVSIATDGETYGHHQRHGDMALTYCLYHIETNRLASISIFPEYLEKHPPVHEVEIVENSSWSCIHGIERWRDDCGCNSGMHPGWHQGWRLPLRNALDWLRDTLIPLCTKEIALYLKDPWLPREEYIDVILDRSEESVQGFLTRHAVRELSREEKTKSLKLLEIQRHTQLMFTSCGWFFDEISGIETVQVLQYASRALQLAREVSGIDLEKAFMEILSNAPSNIPEHENGARILDTHVKPAIIDLVRVGAHYAVSSLFEDYPEEMKIFCFTNRSTFYDLEEAGRMRLVIGNSRVFSEITWEEATVSYAVVHLGDHNLFAGGRPFQGDEDFSRMRQEIREGFQKSDVPRLLILIEKHFGSQSYSLWHLFKDEQQKVLNKILISTLQDIETAFRQVYEFRYPIMQVMRDVNIPLPTSLGATIEFIVNLDLRRAIEGDGLETDRLEKLVREVQKWSLDVDKTTLSFVASNRINALMEGLSESPDDLSLLSDLEAFLGVLSGLDLDLNLWKSQNIYFSIGRSLAGIMKEKAAAGDGDGKNWMDLFQSLGTLLRVRIE